MDSRVCLETKGPLENLENQVTKVFMESSVLLVRLVQGESEEYLEREENLVQLVCRDQRESQVHQVQTGQRAAPVPLEHLVILVLQVFKECQEREASLAHLGQKVTEGRLVRKDQRVRQEMMVQGVPQALLALLDLLGPAVRRENPGPKDHMDLQDPEEHMVLEVILALLVLLDLLDHLVPMANQESRESLESQVRREMPGLQDLKAWPVLMDLLGQLVLLD